MAPVHDCQEKALPCHRACVMQPAPHIAPLLQALPEPEVPSYHNTKLLRRRLD